MSQMIRKIRVSLPFIAVGVLYFYFGYHTLSGKQGLLKWRVYSQNIKSYEKELASLQVERMKLESRADLLRADHLSLDFLDEQARRMLNVSHTNEVIIWLDEDL